MALFGKKKQEHPFCTAVIPAAGLSTRMGTNKMFMDIGGNPVIALTLTVIEQCPEIDCIIITAREDDIIPLANICKDYEISKVIKIVKGGKTRVESVLAGVIEAPKETELIAIHDGARPLVTVDLITKVILEADEFHAATLAVPVKDTIKSANENFVERTLDRSKLYIIQTPQVFDADLINAALSSAIEKNLNITDDCSAIEAIGMSVKLVESDYANIKITTPEDIIIAKAILEARSEIL